MTRYLIVNADDFGASGGVNRGILECHTQGVLTSTSLMVTGSAVDEAVAISHDYPNLAVGLHWDVWGEDEREFDIENIQAVRAEFHRQVEQFYQLMGRGPTHVDSHRHAHRESHLLPVFKELVASLGVPLRDDGQVRFVGGFYAQWEWMVTNLAYVSVPFLQEMLRNEVPDGWTEFSCHPGYISADYNPVYGYEREAEIRTLIDPRIRQTIDELDIQLVSYADWPRLAHSRAGV
jgi:chitin disaccharide deacetylase